MSLVNFRLPREIEETEEAVKIRSFLSGRFVQLREGGELQVPLLPAGDALKTTLLGIRRSGGIVRGVDQTVKVLENEQRGLEKVCRRDLSKGGERLSRLVFLSSDAGERLRRQVENRVKHWGERVLICVVEMDSADLGELLFGHEQKAQTVMICRRDAVMRILLSLLS